MAVIKHNLRKHELMGLFLKFLGTTCYGIGLFTAFANALRPVIMSGTAVTLSFTDVLLYMLFFGVGAILNALGEIELKESLPAKYR
jgi:hypothetical protein